MGARRRTILGKKAESFFFTKDFCKVTDDKIRSLTLSSFLLGRLRGPVTALPNWQSIRI